MANRQWCQSRLARAGLVPVQAVACRLCVAHGLCDPESADPKFRGTLVHRIWTCPVTAPQRNESVPSKLLQKVTSMLRDDFTLPTGDVLFFTRALHRSLEPQLAQAPQCESFNWHVPPPRGGVPLARVYADGSRLFAEHRYCGLAARQGWAFVIVGDDGRVLASASGNTPWWAEGVHAAELWALLNASQNAFPGSSFFVDCESVQIGSKNGTAWAHSPCRTFGRAWIPLSNAVEDYPESVGWMPAHCGKDAIGTLRLSNGEALSAVDLESNDLVDTLAKAAARSSPPSRSELELIVSTSKLVEDVATWIARITVLANHFPCVREDGSKYFIRDSDAKARKTKFACTARGKGKRKLGNVSASPDSLSSLLCVPGIKPQEAVRACHPPKEVVHSHEFFACARPIERPAFKRRRLTHEDFVDRENASFHTHWRASRDLRPPPLPPPISAADRLQAIRDRVIAKKGYCGGDVA